MEPEWKQGCWHTKGWELREKGLECCCWTCIATLVFKTSAKVWVKNEVVKWSEVATQCLACWETVRTVLYYMDAWHLLEGGENLGKCVWVKMYTSLLLHSVSWYLCRSDFKLLKNISFTPSFPDDGF